MTEDIWWLFWRGVVPIFGGLFLFWLGGRTHAIVQSEDDQSRWPKWTKGIDSLGSLYVALTTAAYTTGALGVAFWNHNDGPVRDLVVASFVVLILLITAGYMHTKAVEARARKMSIGKIYLEKNFLKVISTLLALFAVAAAYWIRANLPEVKL